MTNETIKMEIPREDAKIFLRIVSDIQFIIDNEKGRKEIQSGKKISLEELKKELKIQ